MTRERNRAAWTPALIASLLGSSLLLYLLQVVLFRHTRDTLFYLLQDFAFLPVQVLLVTFVLNALIARREKRQLLRKLYMVIGAFFSQVGHRLLERLLALDAGRPALLEACAGLKDWSASERARLRELLGSVGGELCVTGTQLAGLKALLDGERSFLLGLVENPNLLEHESFTEMLLAVFHLGEELDCRTDCDDLPPADLAHLKGDVQRVYRLLSLEWLSYADHLRESYPYMFSLLQRTHPFQAAPSAVVR